MTKIEIENELEDKLLSVVAPFFVSSDEEQDLLVNNIIDVLVDSQLLIKEV